MPTRGAALLGGGNGRGDSWERRWGSVLVVTAPARGGLRSGRRGGMSRGGMGRRAPDRGLAARVPTGAAVANPRPAPVAAIQEARSRGRGGGGPRGGTVVPTPIVW